MSTPQIINGGTVNGVNVGINPVSLPSLNADGSYSIAVQVYLNGAMRWRTITVSADGTTFTLDGQPLTPWAALQTLGNALVGQKVQAVFSAPGAVAPLTGP